MQTSDWSANVEVGTPHTVQFARLPGTHCDATDVVVFVTAFADLGARQRSTAVLTFAISRRDCQHRLAVWPGEPRVTVTVTT
jgi:hypothetical protein